MARPVSHDQNFKNLILDYPREALAFFAANEAQDIDASVTITPLRQEQLKERLGERFRELDVPTLEPDIEKRIKYLDFVDIYTGLSDAEWQLYESRYPQESIAMTGLVERLRTESLQQGMQQGRQEGEQTMLRKLLVRRFGPLDAVTEQRLQQATADDLERWAENLLDAQSLAEVFGDNSA